MDYFVVNVSSPNTPGLRDLQTTESLKKIFIPLLEFNSKQTQKKPVLLKIAPDLDLQDVDDIVDLSIELGIDGLIVSNTTISRDGLQTNTGVVHSIGTGGLSGKPLMEKSNNLLRSIHNRAGEKLLLIGSGGIFTKEDAKTKMESGAKLIQVWTGFVYEGPSIVKKIMS